MNYQASRFSRKDLAGYQERIAFTIRQSRYTVWHSVVFPRYDLLAFHNTNLNRQIGHSH